MCTPGPEWGLSSPGKPTLRAKASGPYRTTIPHGDTARRFQRAHNVSNRMCSWVRAAKRKGRVNGATSGRWAK